MERVPHTVRDARDCFLADAEACPPAAVESYKKLTGVLIKTLGSFDVNELTAPILQGYVGTRVCPGPKPNGKMKHGVKRPALKLELQLLARFLTHAQKRGLFHGSLDIVPRLPPAEYTSGTRVLTMEEFERLAQYLAPKRLPWIALAMFAGGKRTEVEALTWEKVDVANNTIRLGGRRVPMAPALRRMLSSLRRDPEGRLRTGPVVERWTNISREMTAAGIKAGVGPVNANDLRNTFAAWLKTNGAGRQTRAALLGVTPNMVTLLDQALRANEARELVEKLPEPKL